MGYGWLRKQGEWGAGARRSYGSSWGRGDAWLRSKGRARPRERQHRRPPNVRQGLPPRLPPPPFLALLASQLVLHRASIKQAERRWHANDLGPAT